MNTHHNRQKKSNRENPHLFDKLNEGELTDIVIDRKSIEDAIDELD